MIRAFKINDLNSVMKIWMDSNCTAHDFIDREYWEANYISVKQVLPEAGLWVYEEMGTIKGFLGLDNHFVAGVFVKSGEQSKGIGKELIDKAKETHQSLSLKVFVKNTRAVQFYKREEFEISDELTDENTGEREYVMNWSNQ
ncbi:MAG: N-acetyltransferase [Alkalibacterium sp.]|nr:N-acetyltransferase [Alkalibacterium sp.]